MAAADLATAQAQIDSAEAQLESALNNLNSSLIRAPFSGIIAAINVQKGDQASPSSSVATLITRQKIAQISLNEVDATKVKIGQKATLIFDAIPGLTLTGKVSDIDTIGTVNQNVVNYKLKILLDTDDDLVKPGMSVSTKIIIDSKSDILIVPNTAVKLNRDQSHYIETLENNLPVKRTVEVGLVSDSETEISGDIKEGDQAVTQTIDPNKTSSTTTSTRTNSILNLGGGGGNNFRVGGGGR